MRALALTTVLLTAVPSVARSQAPSFRVVDASGCVTEASLREALTDVLGEAADRTLGGLLVDVVVTERHVGIALRRPSGLVGARSLDLGGQACDERHATLALVVAVLASSAAPQRALRVSPQPRWEVRTPTPETHERGHDLGAPEPWRAPAEATPAPAWIFAAGYRLLPRWLPTLGQGLEGTVGGRLGRHALGAGIEAFLPRSSRGRPAVRAAAAGVLLEARLRGLVRPRAELGFFGALGAGVMTGAGLGTEVTQERRARQGYLRTELGLDLALPLGRGLALAVQAGVAATPWRPRFVAFDAATGRGFGLHTTPWVTATFGLGLRWRRAR